MFTWWKRRQERRAFAEKLNQFQIAINNNRSEAKPETDADLIEILEKAQQIVNDCCAAHAKRELRVIKPVS